MGSAAAQDTTRVILETNFGDITLELDPSAAPLTVENFLMYAEDGFYDGLVFHRVMKDFMIQGGGLDRDLTPMPTREPIQNEATNGLRNDRGTIAMARLGAPHSATAQFFINTVDNNYLNQNGANWGYAVFGRVIDGMDVVDTIGAMDTSHAFSPAQGRLQDVPNEDVVIQRVYQP
ncbi:MAG: peptidylprolyl isomerase [Natronospirillum sp.]